MLGNFFKRLFNVVETDKKLKEAEHLLKEAQQIKSAAGFLIQQREYQMQKKIEDYESRLHFESTKICVKCFDKQSEIHRLNNKIKLYEENSKECEQKVKIYEELILKFNLFEKKP